MNNKTTLLALALVAASSSAFASFSINPMTLNSGTFFVAGVTSSPIAWTNTANPTANLVGGYNNFGVLFNLLGSNVSVYTAPSNLGDVNTPAGTITGGPVPSGTMDLSSGTLSVDMSSFFANWSGSDINQGASPVTGTLSGCTWAGCTYNISWSSYITGGPLNGQIGTWSATGTLPSLAASAPEASNYAMMLVGLALVGAVAARQRKNR